MGAAGNMHAFLFTDVAGSTGLWERFPREMERAYARHDAILRTAAADHAGIVYKVIGDAFQIAFPSPVAALAAAIEAQTALTAEVWPLPMPLQVRMALHAGTIAPDRSGDFRSPILNRLGRLLGAGHGGQILLSDAMAIATIDRLPDQCGLRSLGRHRLRDFPEPEAIHQATGPGLPADFAPLITAEPPRFNLPAPPNDIIGRADDVERIAALFQQNVRLITLTGPGGAGKTRLAIEAGYRLRSAWSEGVALVELAPVSDPAQVLPAIADALGLRADGEQSPGETLAAWLANRELLLLLDNFEQIIDAATDVARLLAAAPGLRVIVTSREALHIRAERQFPVELLPLPDPELAGDVAAIAAVPSVQLFVERATAVSPRFALDAGNVDDVAAICRQVEGLPLAIELAAARIAMLSPAALLARLTHRLDLLTGGARDLPNRQQTLRATIGWSYDLLSPADRALFRSLAVFSGGFDLNAACGVTGDADLYRLQANLDALAEKHLLGRITRGDEDRYVMLESVRAFALEALTEADEATSTRRRHAGWYHRWVVESPDLNDPAGLDRLETEHNNLRAAIAWADEAGEAAVNLELAGALARFWQFRGYVTEGRRALERALANTPDEPSPARQTALSEAGTLANANGDYTAARTYFEAALTLAETLHDQSAIAAALNSIGGVVLADGDTAQAESFFTRSLSVAEAAADRKRQAVAMSNLGAVAHYRGDLETARHQYEAALEIARDLNDLFNIALLTGNLLMLLAPFPESHQEAIAYGEESLRCCDLLGDHQGKGYAFDGLGTAAESCGDGVAARQYYERALAQFRAAEDPSGIARAIGGLGSSALLSGDLGRAIASFRESLFLHMELNETDSVVDLLDALAECAAKQRGFEVAATLYGATDRWRSELEVAIPAQLAEGRARAIGLANTSLGERLYGRMIETGSRLSLDELVDLAATIESPIDKAHVP